MDCIKTKKSKKRRVFGALAILCALATLLGIISIAFSMFSSPELSAAGEFDSIYIDGTGIVDYHGAQYSVDENGNVWEEIDDTIRLVGRRIGARLLAVYSDTLYVLTEKDGEYSVSEISCEDGKLSRSVSLGKDEVCAFSMADAGIYYMAGRKIFLAEGKKSSEVLNLSGLVYVCDEGHEHGCEDGASPASAKSFSIYTENSILLHSENPNYIEETDDNAALLTDNSKYISFVYDFSNGSLARFLENTDEGSVSTLNTTEKITLNGVTVPFDKYPPSTSYFTKNGRACTCHNRNQCLNNASPCNCVRYLSSIGEGNVDLAATQCFGFARYCQYKIFGYFDSSSNMSKFDNGLGSSSWKSGTFTASKLKDMLLENGAGGHFRTNGHSLFVISVNATGFTTYECNTSNKDCKVYTRNWTWATFYDYTKSRGIDYYKIPKSFKNPIAGGEVSYPTGEYLIEAEGGLRLRKSASTGAEILATIPNGTLVAISETVKIDGASTNAWWGKTTYGGKTGWISLDYATLQSKITGIKIVTLPNRVTFNQDEAFSYEGLEITLQYANGTSSSALSSGFTVSVPNMSKAGVYDVKVSFSSYSATYEITVKSTAILPEKITFDRPTITIMTGGEFVPAFGIDYDVLPKETHDKTVEWTVVSGGHLVSVDKTTGVVTAVKASSSFVEGYATIRAACLAEDAEGKRVNVYSDYVVEVIRATDNGEWSQSASNIPDGVSLSDYIIEYCANATDYANGVWKKYTESTTTSAYKYRFKNAYKLTWYYDLGNADGNIELPSSFDFPESVRIGEAISVSGLKAVTQNNKIFAGWFTTAEAARNLDTSKAYRNAEITADTEFFAGWIDLSSNEFLVTAADNDPAYASGTRLSSFGVFGADVNVSDTSGGLRFYGYISTPLRNKLSSISSVAIEYGMVVQIAANAGEELRSSTGAGYVQDGHSIVVDADLNYGKYKFAEGNEYTVFTTLVTNIPLENAKTEIAARAFIVYRDANGIRRAFYFTNTAANTENLGLVAKGVKTSMYSEADRLFDTYSAEEQDWLRENVLGYGYVPKED